MKRVAHIIHKAGRGGSEKYVLDIIKNYGPEHCIVIYTIHGPLVESLNEMGVKCYCVHMRHPFDLMAANAVAKIFRKENISTVHAHFLRENYISILSKLFYNKPKILWTYHVNVEMQAHIRFLNRIITRFNEKVLAVSSFIKKELTKRGIHPKKIKVIYNGINIPNEPFIKESGNHDVKRLAIIGRLSEEKGHEFLLHALSHLLEKYQVDDWVLDIVGEGHLESTLKELTEKYKLNKKVNFLGYRSDIMDYLKDVDIVVIPSKNESLSYTGLESAASGKPIICTNIGGLPEIVENNKSGYIVEYGDVDQLAKKLADLIQSDTTRVQFGKNGYELARKKFNSDEMIKQLIEIYNQ